MRQPIFRANSFVADRRGQFFRLPRGRNLRKRGESYARSGEGEHEGSVRFDKLRS